MREVRLIIPDDVQEWFEYKAPRTAQADTLRVQDVQGMGDHSVFLVVTMRLEKE